MLESKIENRLRRCVKALGGIAYKFSSPGHNSVPDRIVLLPKGRIYFVELKSPKKFPRPLQKIEHTRIIRLGFEVFIIDSYDSVDNFIARITK